MDNHERYLVSLRELWDRSAYDRGFISNPFAGDETAALGLKRTRMLLDQLGEPDRALQLLHVAGSKGKGSTCAFASSILTAAGLRTGRYTSPHLHTFRERFAIDGEMISEEHFTTYWDRATAAAAALEERHPEIGAASAFELNTAMAFDYFARSGCVAAVIEVGLGGTLDSTNVILPKSTIITALDFEHTRVLGSTMAEIAANKAGIIKPGVPLATAALVTEAEAVVAAKVQETGSPWLRAGADWTWQRSGQSYQLTGPWGVFDNLSTGLIGEHQMDNASLAIAGLWPMLGDQLTADLVRDPLSITTWPGRFDLLERDGRLIVIDGAHTRAAAAALTRAFASNFPGRRVTLILGLLNDKDPIAIMRELEPIVARVIAVTPPTPRGLAADTIASVLMGESIQVDIATSIDDAFARSAGEALLVTGSLTTAGWAREYLGLAVPDLPIPG